MKRLAIALMLLAGCGDRQAESVVAIANGRPVLLEDVQQVVRINARLLELAKRPVKDEKFSDWARQEATRIFDGMVNTELLMQEIERRGEKPEAEDYAKTLRDYEQGLGRKLGSLDELAALFEDLEQPFRRQFERSAQLAAFARRHWQAQPTEREVTSYFQMVSNLCRQAQVIERDARAHAASALARLSAGEDWLKVAETCSEDKLIKPANERFSREWMVVGPEGFGYPELAAALPKMKVGEVYPVPLNTDEGLLIVKLLAVSGKSYKLARILFRQAKKIKVPTVEEARKLLASEKSDGLQVNFMNGLRGRATLSYPQGLAPRWEITRE